MTDRPVEQSCDSIQDKLRLLFVLHNHQPLGNFDKVIQAKSGRGRRR